MSLLSKIIGFQRDYGTWYTMKKIYYRYLIKYRAGKKYFPFAIDQDTRISQEAWQPNRPVSFSIVVPLYNTRSEFLKEMIDSVANQTYENWELCLADASDASHEFVEKTVKEYQKQDSRIKYKKLTKNSGISENTNAAMAMATGDYIVLFDHDDLLHPSALYYCAKTIEEKQADFIYTDELSFAGTTDKVQSIHFKPDFSPELLHLNNYICHLTVFKKALLDVTGGFRQAYDGSQDYDMILRLTDAAQNICHISQVLYYWRIHAGSVAGSVAAKPYTIDAGKRALEDHLLRRNLPGTVSAIPGVGPFYRVDYAPSFKTELFEVEQFAIDTNKLRDVLEKTQAQVLVFKNKEASPTQENWQQELVSCLVPEENVVAGATVTARKKIKAAGAMFSHTGEGFCCFYKGIPKKERGYMYRLLGRQNVPFVWSDAIAIKVSLLRDIIGKVKCQEIEISVLVALCCEEAKRQQKYVVVTPFVTEKWNGKPSAVMDHTQISLEGDMGYSPLFITKFGRYCGVLRK